MRNLINLDETRLKDILNKMNDKVICSEEEIKKLKESVEWILKELKKLIENTVE